MVHKSSVAKRHSTTVRKKKILRIEVHKHVHRRFAGIRGGKKSGRGHLTQSPAAPSTPAIQPSSYADMF